MNQLLAVGVGVRTELINDNLVFRLNLDNFKHLNIVNSYLLKALVESIEGLVQLPGDSLDLEVHIMEAVSGLSGLLTNLGFVYSGQFICILAEHSKQIYWECIENTAMWWLIDYLPLDTG